ncbi:VapE domain-containing protein [Polynucleobacter sphagniphilus]|uniref:VapE domain-containing protein n=1 Tax=Polynucleobacter sphagniphilus TaxID=1743169 RepID=UPI002474AE1A|nr:VapE domain-containing protein [Polynucleobacter sphagniphilus]MDH6299421.1 hypothetical protein [Polynucleobacter sphagniphilus]
MKNYSYGNSGISPHIPTLAEQTVKSLNQDKKNVVDIQLGIGFSFGKNKWDNQPKNLTVASWNEFIQFVDDHRAPQKGLNYITSAMGGDGRRCKVNALARNFLPMDNDGNCSEQEFVQFLDYFSQLARCVVYETASSKKHARRFRVLIALDQYVEEDQLKRIAMHVQNSTKGIAKLEDGGWDASVYNVSQPLYLPPTDAVLHRFEGKPFSVDDALAAVPPEPNKEYPAWVYTNQTDALAWFIENDLVLGRIDSSKVRVICPWVEDHTGHDTTGTVLFRPSMENRMAGGFKCHHSHCNKKEIKHVYEYINRERGAVGEVIVREDAFGEMANLVALPSAQMVEFKSTSLLDQMQTIIPTERFPHTIAGKSVLKIKDTLQNMQYLLSQIGLTVARCQIRKTNIFYFNGSELVGEDTFEETMAINLGSFMRLNGMESKNARDYINAIGNNNPINPVVDYLSALGYDDSQDWIRKLVNTLDVEDPDVTYKMFKVWFTQACAAADNGRLGIEARKRLKKFALPKFSYVLLAVGTQGTNKTSGLESLLPAPLRKFFGGGMILDLKNKDSLVKALSYWVGELGELDATFSKSDIASLKAFLSGDTDDIRLPYKASATKMRRRTAFVASVNDDMVLKDPTGNRRYLPFRTSDLMHKLTDRELDMVWGQAWHLYVSGEAWWPEGRALAEFKESAEKVTEKSAHYEILSGAFNWNFDAKAGDVIEVYEARFTASEIAIFLDLHKGYKLAKSFSDPSGEKYNIEEAKKKDLLIGTPPSNARHYGTALKQLWSHSGATEVNGVIKLNSKDAGEVKANAEGGKNLGWKLPKGRND